MSELVQPDTEQLLEQVERGDEQARNRLLNRHRQRLRDAVALRMDSRLQARIDPSDVVQDALLEANEKLADYLQNRTVPYYVWLRALALERLIDLRRRHVRAKKRSVEREEKWAPLSDESVQQLTQRLVAGSASPSGQAQRKELHKKVKQALNQLAEPDREILVLRHLEQLKVREIASILGISQKAAKMRHLRALERLRDTLGTDFTEGLI